MDERRNNAGFRANRGHYINGHDNWRTENRESNRTQTELAVKRIDRRLLMTSMISDDDSSRMDERRIDAGFRANRGHYINRHDNWRTENRESNRTQRELIIPINNTDRPYPRRHQLPNEARTTIVGYKLLESWSKEEVGQLFMELSAKQSEFASALETNLDNKVVLAVKVLARIREMPPESRSALTKVFFKEKFIDNLAAFAFQCAVVESERERNFNKIFWNDVEEFFMNLVTVMELWLEIIPTKACMHSGKLLNTLDMVLPRLELKPNIRLSDTLKGRMKKFESKFNVYKEELERKSHVGKGDPMSAIDEYRHQQPPDDFRQQTVYPIQEELFHEGPVFLRKHIVSGKYDSVDHYLDVQFRLLKEDFVCPLRKALKQFLEVDPNKKRPGKISDIRVYRKAILLQPYYDKNDVGVLVQFYDKPMKINFAKSKRLLYGSLVCFSRDNFANVTFGKVIQRDLKMLERSQVVVGFDKECDSEYVFNEPYIMIECSIYFEPYYHVLRALQLMSEDTFPLKRYLIDVEPNVEVPDYLENAPSLCRMIIKGFNVPIFHTWPSAAEMDLNLSQYVAFKAALMSKFAVIQGPPGTGKTFLGLQIIKTLLGNQQLWFNYTPILIVCFTNHALDQFLEGLLTTTNSIVRIGNRSKNQALDQFGLKNLRTQQNVRRSKVTRDAMHNARLKVSHLSFSIKNIQEALLAIERSESVFDFRYFKELQIHPFVEGTWFATASNENLLRWLLGGRTHENRVLEGIEARANEITARIAQTENTRRFNEEETGAMADVENDFFEDPDFDDTDEILEDTAETTDGIFRNCCDALISVTKLSEDIQRYQAEFESLDELAQDNELLTRKINIESCLVDLCHKKDYIRMQLSRPRHGRPRKPTLNLNEPHNIYSVDRWMLYFYCLDIYKTHLHVNLIRLEKQFKTAHKVYSELKEIEDAQLMKHRLVIGMTTTAAARLQSTLQMLKCRIVLVEEAAEVLESHITVSLTKHCQHLILIGDHLQLRPSTADYGITTKFNLGISMFERMVINNVQCHQLNVQHRMRPEIAQLISPNIYPTLNNHESVNHYPPIKGVDYSLYFIDHQHRENETGDESKSNPHEVHFLLRLTCYLIQNGYCPQDITIITPYLGQLFLFMDERKKYNLLMRDVRITVLDNYQGEESKIILLSLVRNNTEGNVGFLKIENRVCVALSRAKEGMYVMGNMQLLCDSNDLWPKIRATLETQEALGRTLSLRCQIHGKLTNVQDAHDFDRVPEGGCNKICGFQLKCGHTCTMTCHILDREHQDFKCKENCLKVLCKLNHVCPKMCYENCGLCEVSMARVLQRCGHRHSIPCHVDLNLYKCTTLVEAKLPCNHIVKDKPCYKSIIEHPCSHMCDTRVEPCGHACTRRCHRNNDPDHVEYKCYKKCERIKNGCSTNKHVCDKSCWEECSPCDIIVKKKRSNCSHIVKVQCNKSSDETLCKERCQKMLPCGHFCKNLCHEACGNCRVKVTKKFPVCGHATTVECSKDPDRKDCQDRCPLRLACGHPCKKACNEPCTRQCEELVDHKKPVACGHKFKIKCHKSNLVLAHDSFELLSDCNHPCGTKLSCDHLCSGTCGSCAQSRMHQTCQEKCDVTLICGHPCITPCRKVCQPCNRPCLFRCPHSKCGKKCSEPCTPCVQPCLRSCKHVQCKAKCGELCTVAPCDQECRKKLNCGHTCVGFCGDPCPKLCRICDAEELTTIFLGFEDEEDARFVQLQECGHVIESRGMEMYFEKVLDGGDGTASVVQYRRCPRCRTTLTSTHRYSDHVKRVIADVVRIKAKFLGNSVEIESTRQKLNNRIISFNNRNDFLYMDVLSSGLATKFLHQMQSRVMPIYQNKRQAFDLTLGRTLAAKLDIFEQLMNVLNKFSIGEHKLRCRVQEYAKFLILRLIGDVERITNQEISDFEQELKRFDRLLDYCKIAQQIRSNSYEVSDIAWKLEEVIFKPGPFFESFDAKIKKLLVSFQEMIGVRLQLTENERRDIVRAMSVAEGAWYKCPNGHYYCIANCGRAMVVQKCIECNAMVGGTQHVLLGNNSRALDMH